MGRVVHALYGCAVMITRTVHIPGMRLESPNRRRGMTKAGIYARARRDKAARSTVWVLTKAALTGVRAADLSGVHCIRVAPRRLDDDNAVAAFKRPIDSVCKALGIDDAVLVIFGDRPGPRLTYEQRSEGTGVYAVRFELSFGGDPRERPQGHNSVGVNGDVKKNRPTQRATTNDTTRRTRSAT